MPATGAAVRKDLTFHKYEDNLKNMLRVLNAKAAAGMKPRGVHHLRAVLRTALNQALRWGDVPRNVAA